MRLGENIVAAIENFSEKMKCIKEIPAALAL